MSSRVAADSHPVGAPRTPKRLNGVTHAACSLARSLVGHRANSSIAPNYDLHSVMTLLVAAASRPSPVTTLRVDRSMSSCTSTCDAWRGLTRGKSGLNEARTSDEFVNRLWKRRRLKHVIFYYTIRNYLVIFQHVTQLKQKVIF